VIQAYKESNIQEDTLLYALGRAYSSYATHLLSDQYGYAVRSNQFDLGAGRNALSEDQLAEYRKYRHQAIHTYQQLAESSPDFQTIVGPISNKVANEHMVAYFDLWMFQNEEEALKELKADLYDVYYLSLAKNYLSSCAPNAILFTGGDNDTYPLLYVQKKLGYRPDVSVVNVSFMNVRRYIHALRNTTPVVNFTLTDESYADDGPNAYLLVDNQIDKVISADKFIEMIGQEHPALRRDIGNSFYHAIPSKQLRVQVDSAKIEELKNDLTESLQQVFTPGLELIITRSGIEKKDLAFLDLLIANQWERPVYFNYTSKNLLGFVLNNRTVQEGMTYRLFPINSYDAVNHERMYDYFLNQFSWDFGNRSENREGGFISNYRGAINNLVEALIEANENDKALEILTLSLMKMPHEKFPYNYFNAIQVKFLIQLHQMEKAKNLARVLKQDCVQSLRAVSEGSHKSQNFIVEKLAILSTLGKVFQDINETKLANEYLSALQTYQDLRR